MKEFVLSWEVVGEAFGLLVSAVLAGLVLHAVFLFVLERMARRTRTVLDDSLLKHCKKPVRLILPLISIAFVTPLMNISPSYLAFLRHLLSLCIIASVAWLFTRMTFVLEDLLLSRYKIEEKDNLEARKIYTQFKILQKIAIIVVFVLTLAVILMTFERVRQLGASILASAGIIGIVVGLATQRTIASLLAGLQIAITQPIRVDDVVIAENEWGRIEEITFTYVVIRLWDLRRLIVPTTYFIEKPFQNWTRVTADIMGSVFLYVDYSVPVDSIREELHRILRKSSLWDGRTWGLQVTNATERTVELRALMSAPDASSAWNLRCEVREKLIEFVRNQHPNGLPRVRAEIQEAGGGNRGTE